MYTRETKTRQTTTQIILIKAHAVWTGPHFNYTRLQFCLLLLLTSLPLSLSLFRVPYYMCNVVVIKWVYQSWMLRHHYYYRTTVWSNWYGTPMGCLNNHNTLTSHFLSFSFTSWFLNHQKNSVYWTDRSAPQLFHLFYGCFKFQWMIFQQIKFETTKHMKRAFGKGIMTHLKHLVSCTFWRWQLCTTWYVPISMFKGTHRQGIDPFQLHGDSICK